MPSGVYIRTKETLEKLKKNKGPKGKNWKIKNTEKYSNEMNKRWSDISFRIKQKLNNKGTKISIGKSKTLLE